jgi:uncharacterized protein involved in exopolysaccharide biosynthesis
MSRLDDEEDEGSAELFDREQIRNYVAFTAGAVRRHRRLVAGVITTMLALTTLALLVLPRTYHVEAKLLAQRNPVLAVRGDGQDAVAPTRGAVEAIRRRDNLVALIEATNLLQHWKDHRAPAQRAIDGVRWLFHGDEDEQERIDAMVERLEKRLVAWTNDGTVVIAIDWPDARMASRLVDVAQQNFLEMRYAQEITALAESIAILRSHAAHLRGDVDEAVAALEKLRDKRQPPGAQAEGSAVSPVPGQRPTARRAAEPSPDLEQIQALLNAKRRALDDLEERRRQRLSEMQARLAEQRTTYTENHPIIIDLQQTIAAMEAPSPQIKALREEIASLRAQHERLSGEHGAPALPARGVAASAAPLRLPSEILRFEQELREDKDPATIYARGRLRDAMDKYASSCEKVEAAQIDIETAQAAFKYRYSVLTPAKVPKQPVKPSVLLVLLAGFVAAVFVAILVVVVADIRSGVVVERWQIERLLGRPILGDVAIAALPKHQEDEAR